MRTTKEYPEGATWEADQGTWHYEVYLYRIDYAPRRFETWFVDVYEPYSDGSVHTIEYEWYPSKLSAFRAARGWMNKEPVTRFKRIK